MPSTYSSNLKIELQANGENAATWGDITNTNLGTALEQAIVGYGTANFLSDANLTLTFTNSNSAQTARALVLNLTSAVNLTTTRQLIVPTIQKQYIVQNNTLNGQSITVKTAAGSGVTIPNGRKMHVYVDGTNVIQMFDFQDTLTLSGALSLSGGTANGVTYLNASKVVTSGSSFTFDGTSVNIGGNGSGARLVIRGTGATASTFSLEAATSAGATRFLVADDGLTRWYGTTNAETMRLDNAGNLGLGVTPSAWDASSAALETLNQVSYSRYGYARNLYVSGGVWRHTTTGVGSYYQQSGGHHLWYVAPSGTAGAAATITQAATLLNTGNFGVGVTTPTARLDVQRDSYGVTGAFRAYDGTNNPRLIISGSADGTTLQHTFSTGSGNLMFAIGGAEGSGTEIARFNASGDFAIAQGNAPTRTLNIYRTGSTTTVMAAGNSNTGLDGTWFGVDGTGNGIVNVRGSYPLLFSTNALERARISAAGIFGIQTVPSAWNNVGALQIGDNNSAGLAFVASDSAGDTGTFIGHGAYYDGSWRYTSTSVGAGWYQILGPNAGANHAWFAAPGGTAAAAITASTQIMTLTSAGFLGLGGVTSPTAMLTLEGTSNRSILLGRNTTVGGQGRSLTVQAGGVTPGTSNTAGGNLILASGISTGSQSSEIEFRVAQGGGTGATDRTPTTVARIYSSGAFSARALLGEWPSGSGKSQVLSLRDASYSYLYLGVDTTNGSDMGGLVQAEKFLSIELQNPSTFNYEQAAILRRGSFNVSLATGGAYVTATSSTTTLSVGVDNVYDCEIRTNQYKPLWFYTNATQRGRITDDGDWVFGVSALSTSATTRFVYLPTCAGVPTGTPTGYTGTAPMVIDTTNHRLYFYSGGAWRNAGP